MFSFLSNVAAICKNVSHLQWTMLPAIKRYLITIVRIYIFSAHWRHVTATGHHHQVCPHTLNPPQPPPGQCDTNQY